MYSTLLDMQMANADLFFRLASKSIDAFERASSLTVDSTRSMVGVAHRDTVGVIAERKRDVDSGHNPLEFLPSPEQAQSYARQLFDIASGVQAELADWTRQQIGRQQETMRSVADQFGKLSDSAARTADQYSGLMRQGADNVSNIAERGARDTAATAEDISKTARRATEQGSGAQKQERS